MKKLFVVVTVLAVICITVSTSHSAEYWAKTYGGAGVDHAYTIQQTTDGGFIVAWRTTSFSAGDWDWDIWVLKLDRTGGITWQKTYGGEGLDEAYAIQQTSDGGYIVGGITSSFNDNRDAWILKLDSIGNVIWQKTYDYEGGNSIWAIQQTTDGGYIATGRKELDGTICVLKLDSAGNITWEKTYGGNASEFPYSLKQTSDGGYIVACTTASFGAGSWDFWILKLNSSGDVTWEKTYGRYTRDDPFSIQQTVDGGYIVGAPGRPARSNG